MITGETLESLYKIKLDWVPSNIYKGIENFNVFKSDMSGNQTIFTGLRKYNKITLLMGECQIFTEDDSFIIDKHAIIFSNPQGAYMIKPAKGNFQSYYCVYNDDFYSLGEYAAFSGLFLSSGVNVLKISELQNDQLTKLYNLMLSELASDYIYKYEAARIVLSKVLHIGMKMIGQ